MARELQQAINDIFKTKIGMVHIALDFGDGRGSQILGCTNTGVSVTEKYTKTEIKFDQGGTTPADKIITGADVSLVTELAGVNEAVVSMLFPWVYYDQQTNTLVGYEENYISERVGNECILRLHKAISEGEWSEKDQDTVSFPLAFASFEEAKLFSFTPDTQRTAPITFMMKSVPLKTLTGGKTNSVTVLKNGKETDVKAIKYIFGDIADPWPPVIRKRGTMTFSGKHEISSGERLSITVNNNVYHSTQSNGRINNLADMVEDVRKQLVKDVPNATITGVSNAKEKTITLEVGNFRQDETEEMDGTKGIEILNATLTATNGATKVAAVKVDWA